MNYNVQCIFILNSVYNIKIFMQLFEQQFIFIQKIVTYLFQNRLPVYQMHPFKEGLHSYPADVNAFLVC